MEKHESKLAIFLIAILLFGTILPTWGNQKSFAAELTDIDYDPYIGNSVKVAPNFELDANSGETFAEGYIKFEISNGYVDTDKLFLPDGARVTLDDGSILEVKGDQILLNDIAIASVNSKENGEGNALKIDLSAPLPNGNFEEGDSGDNVVVPSWTINNTSVVNGKTINQIWLGDLATHTKGRAYQKVENIGDGKYKVTGPNGEYTYITNVNYNGKALYNDPQSIEGFEAVFNTWNKNNGPYGFVKRIDAGTDPTKGQSLEIGFLNAMLNSGDYGKTDGKIASSFGIEAISSPFKAKKGDKLSFDWKANDGGDDYEVYGFLVNTETNENTEILYGRGSAQDWTTNSGTVPQDGTYKFRFVAGSFNRTDGTTHGATLSIDNVRVVSTKVVNGVVNAIAQLVQYENSQYSGDRPVQISVVNSEGQKSQDNNLIIKMSSKDEAANLLGDTLSIDSPKDGSYIYDPESKTISGIAEPDSTVNVTVKSDMGYSFNSTTSTDKEGKWSINLKDNLSKGDYTIEATASKGGATSKTNSSTFTFVDKTNLEQYYNQVKELKKEDYRSGWNQFDSALQTAKEILDNIADSSNNSNPKQEDIDEALTNLQNAKEKLEKFPPVATNPASFEDGNKQITIDFNKNIKQTVDDLTEAFSVTVDGKEYKVTEVKTNGDKVTLTVDQPLDSDAKNVTVEYHPDTTSNLVGEEENGSAVEEFVIQAEDTFGHSLQINEPNGTTYNKTPIIKGSIDKDTEHAEITITDSNGSNIIVDKDNITINPDGSWTYNVAEQLSPGEYEVKVTASKSNRDITKYHKFIVADPPVVDPIPPFGQDLQINEPNDITNDTTPSVKGTTDLDTEQAIITITGSNGSKIIVDKDNMNINSDGSWTYNVNQKLSPGEYEVKVTVSKTGYQDVTKSHKFIVVDKETLVNLKDSITSKKLVESEYTQGSWTKFEDAFNKAKLIINNPKATQIEVDNATTSLQNAYDELVYIKALEDEVKQGNNLVQSNYTKDSWDAYQTALTNATKVLDDSSATKEQVNKAKLELENARKSLTPNVDHTQVDKTQLIKEYELSSELKAVDYTKDSWNNYQKAIAKAKEVINDSKATQEEVDAAKIELENARKSLTPNVDHTQVDKTQLIKEYELSSELKAVDYTKDSWNNYQKAIAKAKEVINDSKATQEEVNAAKIELENARKSLTPNVDHTQVDKTQLIKEYELSSELKAADYSKGSWDNYQKALERAKKVINDSKATQEEVDVAKAELEKARRSLSVDKTQLNNEKNYSEDLSAKDYTKDSWKSYQDALNHAKKILADRNATQYEVNAALNRLKESRNALVRLQDSNNQSKNSDKGILPNTATNTYNWLLFGSAFLLLGALFLLRQKRKESK